MNAQQLRNSILQEAIEGRLVPQDPNDEPASALLKRIREEKRRLVKEGKIVLSKPEKACKNKEEGQFPIPYNWKWAMISDVCRVFGRIGFRGYTKSDLRSSQENAAISISPSNMVNGTMDFTNCTYISEEKYEESPEIKIQNGDILIVKTGSSYGKTSLIENLPWKSTINPQIAAIKDITIETKYLLYFLQSPFAQSNFKKFVLGTSIPTFSQLNLISMQIPLPPLAEQHRIVAKIEELMPKVEEYGKAQEALDKLNAELPEKLKKSILQEAIEGRLVPQDPNDEPASVLLDKIRKEKAQLVKEGKLKKKDLVETPISEDEIPFEIPESWEWCRVKTILSVYSARRVHEKDWRSSGIPFYRAREIGKLADEGYVNNELFIEPSLYEEFSKSGVPLAGDLMVTAVGTLGKTYIVKEGEVFYYKDGSVLCFNNRFNMDAKFLKYYIESPAFISQYASESQGTTVATLTMVRVNEYLIPLPPLAEQHRIVERIEKLMGGIEML